MNQIVIGDQTDQWSMPKINISFLLITFDWVSTLHSLVQLLDMLCFQTYMNFNSMMYLNNKSQVERLSSQSKGIGN